MSFSASDPCPNFPTSILDLLKTMATKKNRNFSNHRPIKKFVKSQKTIICRLLRGKQITLALPINSHAGISSIVIPKRHDLLRAKNQDYVQVRVLAKKQRDIYGQVEQILDPEDLAIETMLDKREVRRHFPQAVLKEAEQFSSRVVAKGDRKDLRTLPFVTIDGNDAKDFDDAVFVEKQEQGWQVYVSIADVAHYTKLHSEIDKEAYLRGTSTYLPQFAIPMLPEKLSNDLCSLRPHVNRLALTCQIQLDAEGVPQSVQIYESVIYSYARLTYQQVDDLFQGHQQLVRSQKIIDLLHTMNELTDVLIQKRQERGTLQFEFPEYLPIFEEGQLKRFQKKTPSRSMKLIEHLMLEANEAVAQYCIKHQLPVLYRIHQLPNPAKLNRLDAIQNLTKFGSQDIDSHHQINQLLKHVSTSVYDKQTQFSLLKAMSLASYHPKNKGHFGLAAEFYTHFTSPIRRYPDLIVHRAIKAYLAKSQKIKLPDEAGNILSQCERFAESVERESIAILKLIYLQKYLGQVLVAQVIAIESMGLLLEFIELELEYFLPLRFLNDDFYLYDEHQFLMIGQDFRRKITIGKKLKLLIKSVDVFKQTLKLRWI